MSETYEYEKRAYDDKVRAFHALHECLVAFKDYPSIHISTRLNPLISSALAHEDSGDFVECVLGRTDVAICQTSEHSSPDVRHDIYIGKTPDEVYPTYSSRNEDKHSADRVKAYITSAILEGKRSICFNSAENSRMIQIVRNSADRLRQWNPNVNVKYDANSSTVIDTVLLLVNRVEISW